MTREDKYSPKGHLEIWKIHKDGQRELHFSDRNTIVSGMGVGLSYLFTGSGSNTISDYQIRWFQVGSGSPSVYGASTYALTSPLISLGAYGVNSELTLSSLSVITNGVVLSGKILAKIPFSQIRRVAPNSVQYLLVLGENTANNAGITLKEIGLFMHNPKKLSPIAPILVTYKTFTPIEKTSDFALVFKWTLTF